MVRFKQAMGFLLMATLVWLLWVLGNQKGLPAVIWTLAFLLALGFALWLHGSLLDLSSSTRRRATVWAASLAIVAAAAVGFLRTPLAADDGTGAPGAALSRGAHVVDGVAWLPFELAALESAVRDGRTVFVDFTAEWCWTCKVNERTVLADGAVTKRMKELDVVAMKGDWTNRDPVITQVLRRFGRSGVPFYAVFPPGQLADPIVLPELINAAVVLQALEKAGPSRTAMRAAAPPASEL
jgi:thiol:disulfide interchange protein DsbD